VFDALPLGAGVLVFENIAIMFGIMGLSDGEKSLRISSFVLIQYTNMTDGRAFASI